MRPREVRDNGYSVGQTLKIYKRVRDAVNNRKDAGHTARVNIGNKIVNVTPNWENQNIEAGTAAGAILAAVSAYVSEYIPVGADTEIVNISSTDNGMHYVVNVDAPLEQQARFQALAESGQGFASIVTDKMEASESEVISKRVARDTWQYEVEIINEEPDNPKDSMGLGLLGIWDK